MTFRTPDNSPPLWTPPSKHARLGASSADTWLTCTQSPAQSANKRRHSSGFAAEGSVAHKFIESELTSKGEVFVGQVIEQEGHSITVDRDMLSAVQVFIEECEECGDNASWVAVERTVNLDELWLGKGEDVPEAMWGTADFMAVKGTTLYVKDYKHGRGVPVEALGNPQPMYYGLGAYYQVPDNLRQVITHVNLAIIQPRAHHPDGPIREVTIQIDELLNWADTVLKPTVEKIVRNNPDELEFKPGKACRWCAASSSCPALSDKAQLLARTTFEEARPTDPAKMTNPELAERLEFLDVFTDWIAKVRAEAMARVCDEGQVIPGWKVVSGRSYRKWLDEDKLVAALAGIGVPAKDIVEMSVKSPAQVEKVLKHNPDALATMNSFVIKPEGSPTLVRDNDTRPAATISAHRLPASEVFKTL